MLQPLLLIIGLIPLVFKLGPLILPETWLESYAYWDANTLNQIPGQEGRPSQWRNMGSWRVGRHSTDLDTCQVGYAADFGLIGYGIVL